MPAAAQRPRHTSHKDEALQAARRQARSGQPVVIPNGWDPRPYQLPAWGALQTGFKRAVLVWHRRAGKDSMSCNWTAKSAMERVGLYWHLAPTQRQVRKIVWDGLDSQGRRVIDQAFPQALRARTVDDEMKIQFCNGSMWQCVGSDNFDTLVGPNPVGVVFSEWSLADPRAWDFIRPILAENGGWAIFIYTPRGRNHGEKMLELARADPGRWFSQVLTVADTNAVPASVVEEERLELVRLHGKEDGTAIWLQEWHCSFAAAIRGAYYAFLMERAEAQGRVGRVSWIPDLPVHTAWDLGIGDQTAIWFFQMVGREVHIIDYLIGSGVGLSWYVNRLWGEARFSEDAIEMKQGADGTWRALDASEEAGHRRLYQYGEHIGPHDAAVSELGTGKRRVDTLWEMGVRMRVLPRTSVDDGIQAVRTLLPRCWFDAQRCAHGISALKTYHKAWDDKHQILMNKPEHDWTSDPADAFRTLAVGQEDIQHEVEPPKRVIKPFTEAWMEYDGDDEAKEERRKRWIQ